jgi:hypothetical protein
MPWFMSKPQMFHDNQLPLIGFFKPAKKMGKAQEA